MKVTLVNHTANALATLVFTKSTRLKMSGVSFNEVLHLPTEKLMEEWQYMQNTIKSSWEFVDYIFMIEGVSRAFTQQLERHRIGTSFAEQSLRTVDASEFPYINTCKTPEGQELTDNCMTIIQEEYAELIGCGEKPEDARGILPLNIAVNIVFKANLRTLHLMSAERLCLVKAQKEFRDVMAAMRNCILAVHPWAEPALRVHCAQHGTCAFPMVEHTKCPIKGGVFNPETGRRYDEHNHFVEIQGIDEMFDVRPFTKEEIQAAWKLNVALDSYAERKENQNA